MKELVGLIDDEIAACLDGVSANGLCHLVDGDNEKYPITIPVAPAKPVKVVPRDNRLIQTYHRALNSVYEVREDVSFGKKIKSENKQRMRLVVMVRLDQADTIIDEIVSALPETLDVDGFSFVSVFKTGQIIRDRQAIWSEEYGKDYKDSFQLKFYLYAVEYDLRYIKCPVCV